MGVYDAGDQVCKELPTKICMEILAFLKKTGKEAWNCESENSQ